mgnify:CR=1 FL=1
MRRYGFEGTPSLSLIDRNGQLQPLAPEDGFLLQLNASDLVHGSYGIEREAIVLTEALELSHLDYEEFQSTYESMTLALASHMRELAAYREER